MKGSTLFRHLGEPGVEKAQPKRPPWKLGLVYKLAQEHCANFDRRYGTCEGADIDLKTGRHFRWRRAGCPAFFPPTNAVRISSSACCQWKRGIDGRHPRKAKRFGKEQRCTMRPFPKLLPACRMLGNVPIVASDQ
jgi:hypothetical protein